MDIDQVKTFLAVAAQGSFLEAAAQVHVTQSTVSARIQSLEQQFGTRLFVRNRAGASLTVSGERFLRHAKTLLLTYEQARHEVGLPSRFRTSLTLGARIALWDSLLPRWIGRLRSSQPDVSLNTEIGFEEDLMRRVIAGTMDLALMYSPRQVAGIEVEYLFDETLILVGPDPERRQLDDSYVYVDWGPSFFAQHRKAYPEFERPTQTANIGWLGLQLILANGGTCFVPERVAASYLKDGCLQRIHDSPSLRLPTYVVYPSEGASSVVASALDELRALIVADQAEAAEQPNPGLTS